MMVMVGGGGAYGAAILILCMGGYGQVVNTHVPLSPSSIIWYQLIGGDALRLAALAR